MTLGRQLGQTKVITLVKVNERTVYRLPATKKIQAFKGGETWRFLRSDIEQWIKNQTTGI
jgi:excisionase family DNA binding protein